MPSIDDLAADPNSWDMLRELIRSGQIPERRLAELQRTYPDFWKSLEGK